MGVSKHRGLVAGIALAVLLSPSGCARSEDSAALVVSTARGYIEAVASGDQSRADQLAGYKVDLAAEQASLEELAGPGEVTIAGASSPVIASEAGVGILWTGDPRDAPSVWTLDVQVTASESDGHRVVHMAGWLSPTGDIRVDPLDSSIAD